MFLPELTKWTNFISLCAHISAEPTSLLLPETPKQCNMANEIAHHPGISATSHSWKGCNICRRGNSAVYNFKTPREFVRHLRDFHCNKEGGSYICRYGANGLCSVLPVEGVSDKDYEEHILKVHAKVSSIGILISIYFPIDVRIDYCIVYRGAPGHWWCLCLTSVLYTIRLRIGRSTSPAGNDCLDPYFGLSCVIGWVQPHRVEGFFGHDRKAPYFGKSREAACFGITCHAGSYKFTRVIAITETGCDMGYFGKSRVAACFGITCQAVINLPVS